jgi:translation initiation factor 2 beta subunit (eIF-2beta)/eIF-5
MYSGTYSREHFANIMIMIFEIQVKLQSFESGFVKLNLTVLISRRVIRKSSSPERLVFVSGETCGGTTATQMHGRSSCVDLFPLA